MRLTEHIYYGLQKLMFTKAHTAWEMLALGTLEHRIYRSMQFLISTAELHKQTFTKFRNINLGKDVVVVACGPSVNEYQPIPNTINIGVNRALYFDKIKFDYFFMEDLPPSFRKDPNYIEKIRNYNCVKFYGLTNIEDPGSPYFPTNPPETELILSNALRYRHDFGTTLQGYKPKITYDLSTEPLCSLGSVVLCAIQFALWTNPRRVYLVGCDCTNNNHFYSADGNTNLDLNKLFSSYRELKEFTKCYYPDTEIISVNPVGLKGLFRDWNQKDGPLQ